MQIKALPGTAVIQFSIISTEGYGKQQTASIKFDALSADTQAALAKDITAQVEAIPTAQPEEDEPKE